MAVGKNKKLGKKKGQKKKIADSFAKKEWYEVKAPAVFKKRGVAMTPVNRTAGTKMAADSLKGRVFVTSLADLTEDEEKSYRKIKLRVEDVSGSRCLTNFYGMDLTTDKYRSLVRKWQSLIEAFVDAKTTDGYTLRLFAIAFTKKQPGQLKKTSYAQTSQKHIIRKKMMDIMTREVTNNELNDLVQKFIPEALATQINKECKAIYPLQNVYIRKVKVLKSPKLDPGKLLELHGESTKVEDTGVKA
jgi:small subunit ribosomal protein S3Ae